MQSAMERIKQLEKENAEFEARYKNEKAKKSKACSIF
jgi:hypothetical protein